MAGLTQKYVAVRGITFDKLKARVEEGESLPRGISQSEINELQQLGAITPIVPTESEGDNAASSGS